MPLARAAALPFLRNAALGITLRIYSTLALALAGVCVTARGDTVPAWSVVFILSVIALFPLAGATMLSDRAPGTPRAGRRDGHALRHAAREFVRPSSRRPFQPHDGKVRLGPPPRVMV